MNVVEREHGSKRVCGAAARVIANKPLCREHVAIEVAVPGFSGSQPGQFVQLLCNNSEDESPRSITWPAGGFPSLSASHDWGPREPYLRRPFSIADQWRGDDSRTHLLIVSRAVGPGTNWLEQLAPGDELNVTGPLGHGFEIPSDNPPLLLVGGGVGIPPLVYLTRRLDELGHRDAAVIFGATTRELLPVRLTEEPARDGNATRCAQLAGKASFPTAITTDDGSCGLRGVVTDAITIWHARLADSARSGAVVFACGPGGMLSAVTDLTRRLGLGCQLCIERKMGCGLGTCLSCIVRVHDTSKPEGWRWALTCEEGPVFDRDRLFD